jgi:KUP system potassium uptake protein
MLSLILWALVVIVVLKYLVLVLRADNQGEGGVLALLGLLAPRSQPREGEAPRIRGWTVALCLGLLGAGLVAADGVITPAISVLGALEGIAVATPALEHAVVPLAIVILSLLFLVQRHGTGRIGAVFGPVLLAWFSTLFLLGLPRILRRPEVLEAVDPRHGLRLLARGEVEVLPLLGSVVLCFTGAEALYADLGHFGRAPIRRAWFWVAFPALLASYFGQGALLHARGSANVAHPFFDLAPAALLYPLIGLATTAAVLASQALISGVFSLAMQAVHLGFLPRVTIRHTSAHLFGQVYLPVVNGLLMASCLAAVLVFRGTSGLAAAYGLAVVGAMAITTLLLARVPRSVWGWKPPLVAALTGSLLALELVFLAACGTKLLHGGYLPVVPGTAVFLTGDSRAIPRALLHHDKHARVLHEHVLLLTLRAMSVPRAPADEGPRIEAIGAGLYRAEARYGFLETPDVPEIVRRAAAREPALLVGEASYFLGRDRLVVSARPGLARWRKHLFAFLHRDARPADAFFHVPANRVVELGAQVEI